MVYPDTAEGSTMTHWRIADDVAWVGDAERVALVLTRDPATAVPMHVQAPFAVLWTALESGPVAQTHLEVIAADLVDEGEAPAFVSSFVESLGGVGAVEQVPA